MATTVTNPRKTEFIKLFRRSGLRQAELARRLQMTRGGMNGIITGPTIPSASALQLLRLTLLTELPETMVGVERLNESDLAPAEKKVIRELRRLESADRTKLLEEFKSMIASYRSKPGSRRS